MTQPTPGLQGDYRDSCIACIRPTDTGLAIEGEAEWIIAVLTLLGLSQDEACKTLAQGDPRFRPAGMVPDGRVTVAMRICGECAKKAHGLPVGLITAQGMPSISQP